MKYFIVIALVISFNVFSQNTINEAPKVGLVLSGGGAKGLAHIGALKVIDSLNVKIDYVAGTSMGAIIGALYSSGYSGIELDSIFKSVDFDKLISDALPRYSKTAYDRDNSEKYALVLPFDNFKVQLPSAISKGQNVFNLLSKLTLHVSHINEFKDLPIPFFCIATNIETGEPVLLESGSLSQAIAASGAFPSLFQPVVIKNSIFIDGGVVNNYPIDELKKKNIDIIIGVDVQDSLSTRQDLKTAPDILTQINNYRTINAMKNKAKKTDIYIKPDIKAFSVVSFNEGKRIIDNGERAAILQTKPLNDLPKKQKNHTSFIKPTMDSLYVNAININGNEKYTRAYILGKLKLKTKTKVSYEDFAKGVNNLVATNNFKSFLYDFKPQEKGFNLDINITENNINTYLKLGLHYDGLYKSAALVNVTKKQLLFKNDITSIDFILGDNIRYDFNYFIDKGFYWSIGLKSRFNTFDKNVSASLLLPESVILSTGINKLDIDLKDFTNQLYAQTLFTKDLTLTLGLEHKRLKISSETLSSISSNRETIFEKSNFFSTFGNFKLDTYDNQFFPRKGVFFNADFHLYLTSSDFNNNFSQFSFSKAKIGYAFGLTDRLAINLDSEGGFRIGDDSNNSLTFALGGYGRNFINNFISFYGYDYISLAGDSFVKGTINLDYKLGKNHHVNVAANYSNIGNDIFRSDQWISAPEFSGYALGYGFESFLGPLEIKYTWSPETNDNFWFFNLGFWF